MGFMTTIEHVLVSLLVAVLVRKYVLFGVQGMLKPYRKSWV